jgi:hypothetical protein
MKIPTNEEMMIAQRTFALVRPKPDARAAGETAAKQFARRA